MQTNTFIEKNRVATTAGKYRYTTMVSHRGVPISFAMRDDGRIFYSVLDLSNPKLAEGRDPDNDRSFWSPLNEATATPSLLRFPRELGRVGYGVVPNRPIDAYDAADELVVQSFDGDGVPLDGDGNPLTPEAIRDRTDPHRSSTARLGAIQPFEALSDGKHVYVFRQALETADPADPAAPALARSLLVDRFVQSGAVLKPAREVRYQRSRHKTEPESRKDTLAAVDMDGNPFYEPTRELAFVGPVEPGRSHLITEDLQ